jgi:hypothetical protein
MTTAPLHWIDDAGPPVAASWGYRVVNGAPDKRIVVCLLDARQPPTTTAALAHAGVGPNGVWYRLRDEAGDVVPGRKFTRIPDVWTLADGKAFVEGLLA